MKKNWYKGLTATAISLAMAGAAVSVPAFAIEYDLANGDVYVSEKEDGTVESWQTDAEGEFYLSQTETGWNGERVNSRYQHTQTVIVVDKEAGTETRVEKTDNDVIITQSNPETATDNTVTVSGNLKGEEAPVEAPEEAEELSETDPIDYTADDVNITIKDVNATVDANGTTNTYNSDGVVTGTVIDNNAFLNVTEGTTADITLNNVDITVDANETLGGKGAGIYVEDGSDIFLNLVGENTITGINLPDPKQGSANTNINGIRIGGSIGDSSSGDADLDISGTGSLTITSTGTGIQIGADSTLDIYGGSTVNINDTKALPSTSAGRGINQYGELTISGEGTSLNIKDVELTHLSIDNDTTNKWTGSNFGYGIDSYGNLTIDNGATVTIDSTKSTGIYKHNDLLKVDNGSTLTITNASLMGINLQGSAQGIDVLNNSRIHTNNTRSHGIGGAESNTYNVMGGSEIVIDTTTSGSGIQYGNLYMDNGTVKIINQGGDYGWLYGAFLNSLEMYNGSELSILADKEHTHMKAVKAGLDVHGAKAIISDSTLTVKNLGKSGIRLYYGADIDTSVVTTTGSNIGICLYDTSAGASIMTVSGASVLAVDGKTWDFYDDWNNKGYTGRDFMTSGSLQADLEAMYGYYITEDSEIAGKTGLDLFLAIAQKYNAGNGINAIVTGTPTEGIVAGTSHNNTQYSGPVNEDGTLLFRFDLNGEVAHGFALKDNGDGTYTFTYTDPNTLNVYEYTFRYNTDDEDLNGEGNNAYVWAPVTIIHYNPTNNKLNDADLGTATKDSEDGNTASDYTIFGTTINLAEKNMPSYTSPDPIVSVKKEYKDGRIYTTTTTTTSTYGWWVCVEDGKIVDISDKVPGEGATEEDWQKFYSLLNTYVDEETDLLALCGGDTKLAEEITVYGMWKTASEEVITSEPIEFPPYQPDPKPEPKPEPKPDPKPEEPTPVIPEEPTPVQPVEPVTPSIPDEVIDDIIDEVEQLTSVPQTGAEEEADDYAAAAVSAGVLALAVAGLLRRKHRAE